MNPIDYLESKKVSVREEGHYTLVNQSGLRMNLNVAIDKNNEVTKISMAHFGNQQDDPMRDPEIIFTCKDEVITYISMQNDFMDFFTQDQVEIKDYMENTWVPNLIDAEYLIASKKKD